MVETEETPAREAWMAMKFLVLLLGITIAVMIATVLGFGGLAFQGSIP